MITQFARTPADSMARDVGFGPSQWTYHVDLYMAPWNRYQPYLVGALLGYILHHTRGQKMRLDRLVNLVVWQVIKKRPMESGTLFKQCYRYLLR